MTLGPHAQSLIALLEKASQDPPPPGAALKVRSPAFSPRRGHPGNGHRAVACMPRRDWPNGEWMVFASVTEASEAAGTGIGNISAAAKAHRVRRGYYWRFVTEPAASWKPAVDKRTGRPRKVVSR